MKAVAVFPSSKQVKVIDHPEPSISSPTDVKLRMIDVGVCGTDKEIVSFQYGTPPEGSEYLVIGHESLGEVIEIGPGREDAEEGGFGGHDGSAAVRSSGMRGVPGGAAGFLLHRRLHGTRHQGPAWVYDRICGG